MIEAAESTTPAASERIPPTTGSDEEMTVLAVFTAVASVLPVISPVIPMYALKAMVSPVIRVAASHFTVFAAVRRMELGLMLHVMTMAI